MFKLAQSRGYFWPVKITLPAESGGVMDSHTFDAEFKRLPQSRLDEIFASDSSMNDAAVVSEVLVGWAGIVTDSGENLPFSEKNRERLLDIPGARPAIVAAWLESLIGAKAKN